MFLVVTLGVYLPISKRSRSIEHGLNHYRNCGTRPAHSTILQCKMASKLVFWSIIARYEIHLLQYGIIVIYSNMMLNVFQFPLTQCTENCWGCCHFYIDIWKILEFRQFEICVATVYNWLFYGSLLYQPMKHKAPNPFKLRRKRNNSNTNCVRNLNFPHLL